MEQEEMGDHREHLLPGKLSPGVALFLSQNAAALVLNMETKVFLSS